MVKRPKREMPEISKAQMKIQMINKMLKKWKLTIDLQNQ